MGKRHECRYWRPTAAGHRGFRWCDYCGKRQTKHGGEWALVMTPNQFANDWLPMISGTDPKKLMTIHVAAPFEWNCYESWNIVYRVRFSFTDVVGRRQGGLGTKVDIMNGWTSKWHETFNGIDKEARDYYQSRTGEAHQIGDNTYEEMRRIIQS